MSYKQTTKITVDEIGSPNLFSPTSIQIRDLNVTLQCVKPTGIIARLVSSLLKRTVAEQLCTKTILANLSANIQAGTLTAIIGGSGCGKTTLLSTISQRIADKNVEVTGNVSYNGIALRFNGSRRHHLSIPYVVQEDILLPQLTVKETLMYAAQLRLTSMTRAEQEQRVLSTMTHLDLTPCAQTLVGDHTHKGCSGGEKRRISVAIQMLTDSSILFLDEPTTGLDAASAFEMVKVLKSLSVQGRTVVMTIHQPRSDIWSLIDNLIVLSKGTTIFSGQADSCILHLEGAGYPLPPFINPFEHILDTATVNRRSHQSEFESQTRLDVLRRAWPRKQMCTASSLGPGQVLDTKSEECALSDPSPEQTACENRSSTASQIKVLTCRTWRVTCRDRLGAMASIIEAVIMGIVTGWIFYHVGRDFPGIRSREGAMYTAAGLQAYLVLIFETYRLSIDIKVFDRESKEGVSSAVAFVASRRLARALLEDLPVPLIYSLILYFMAGFRRQADAFLVFFTVVYLLHITALNVATFCVAMHREFLVSSLIANTIFVLQSMACGFFVNTADISVWLRWMKWAAYLFYAFGALCYNEFAGQYYDCPVPGAAPNSTDCRQYNGDYILESLQIPRNWVWKPFLALSVFPILFCAFAILTLHLKLNNTKISRAVVFDDDAVKNVCPDYIPGPRKRQIAITLQQVSLSTERRLLFRRIPTYLPVISDVSAIFKAGSLNVIMGPSGCGKTTLLNFMARGPSGNVGSRWYVSGHLHVNGSVVRDSVLRSISAYVPQDDEGILPSLTVRETLRYAAHMRLPHHTTRIQRSERVESLITALGLKDCADITVGNELVKGISGGERKRLSIAIHILADPLVLFLDEPTSGLDSVTASSIIDVLDGLAREGRTIIISVHQPRSEWLARFDTTLVLNSKGCAIYSGATACMLPHFHQMGFDCPQRQNPADFVLDITTQHLSAQVEQKAGGEAAEQHQHIQEASTTCKTPVSTMTEPIMHAAQLGDFARKPLGFDPAFRLLLSRAYVNLSRQPILALGRTAQIIGLAAVLTCFFTPLKHDFTSIQSRMGYVQQICSLYFVGMLNAIAIYPVERDLFFRENNDRLYPLEAFIASYTILEIPSQIVGALIFSLLTVLVVGLPRTPQLVFVVTLNAFCVVSCGESLGIALMTLCSHTGLAVTMCCIIMSISVHITGVISITMPAFLRAMNYISPLKWMSGNLAAFSLREVPFTCDASQRLLDGKCPIETGKQALELYNLDVDPYKYLAFLVGVTVCYRMLAWVVLKVRTLW